MKPKLQSCDDYPVGINYQLADHQLPIPLPEELMQKLGGGFAFTKIDLQEYRNIHPKAVGPLMFFGSILNQLVEIERLAVVESLCCTCDL